MRSEQRRETGRTSIDSGEVGFSNTLSINDRSSSSDLPIRFRNDGMINDLTLINVPLVNSSEIQRRTSDRRSILLTSEEESKEISSESSLSDEVLDKGTSSTAGDSLES